MQLDQLTRHNPQLANLLHQAQYFQQLDRQTKRLLPENLASHFRVVCINPDGALVLYTSSNMAATRLRMLLPSLLPKIQALDERIGTVKIKILPESPAPKREKPFHLNEYVLQSFSNAAERVQHHPELYRAMRNLVTHHQKS